MKKYLLIFLCFFLLMSCSPSYKSHTLVGVPVEGTEIETLPVTADLVVSEQRVKGEASGKVVGRTTSAGIAKEALAKALGQESPSVDKPDVLVGINLFSEVNGADEKWIVTGYPAYYANFRTATKTDSLRLNMFNNGRVLYIGDDKPKAAANQLGGEWYFSAKYQFGDGYGWGIGAGKTWSSNLLGDFFFGAEVEEKGLLSPWKNEDNLEWFGLGVGLNAGGIYGKLPHDLKLVYGLSAGFWAWDCEYEYPTFYGYEEKTTISDQAVLVGPFAKLRWHGLEAGFRLLFGGGDVDADAGGFQFSLGFTI